MQLKPTTAIVVLLLVVTSLLVSGCTTNTTSPSPSPTPTPTPTSTPSVHNAVLEKTVRERQNEWLVATGYTVESRVVWHSNNSVTMFATQTRSEPEDALSGNETLIAFPTTLDATNYLNAFDKSKYSLESTTYNRTHDLFPVVIDNLQTYQQWHYLVSTTPFKEVHIKQYDNIIQIQKIWETKTNEPTV
jgi:predicted membrane-bound mannosyltransferase